MNKEHYIQQLEKRLTSLFVSSKEGYKASPIERNRLEGFMNAGVVLGVITNAELSSLMDSIHMDVFGKTIQARKAELSSSWNDDEKVDYSFYEKPTFERV